MDSSDCPKHTPTPNAGVLNNPQPGLGARGALIPGGIPVAEPAAIPAAEPIRAPIRDRAREVFLGAGGIYGAVARGALRGPAPAIVDEATDPASAAGSTSVGSDFVTAGSSDHATVGSSQTEVASTVSESAIATQSLEELLALAPVKVIPQDPVEPPTPSNAASTVNNAVEVPGGVSNLRTPVQPRFSINTLFSAVRRFFT